MRASNANNATWFMLRYPEQFTPPPEGTEPHSSYPHRLDAALFYDDARHVLELLPERPTDEAKLLPGLAVDADGEIYRVNRATGQILVVCGEHERPLVCEPHVLAGPRGLALDRRGLLYVADARARRVVVLLPEDGSVHDVLDGAYLREPVDVAVAPTGRIYVADRGGESAETEDGQVVVYSARHQYLCRFPAQNAEGHPEHPRPIAVMVDADESVLVADASHPRLLRFTPAGEPLADVELTSLTAALDGGETALDLLHKTFGTEVPRFVAGGCLPPRASRDGGDWLAEVHRALRLLRLRLGQRFAEEGTFISGAFDGGTPGTTWHRIRIEADLPAGTSITVETATHDDAEGLDLDDDRIWSAPMRADGKTIAITEELPEQLIQSRPGRYLWVRATLYSDGQATPSLHGLQIFYPRFSYLDLLPRIYRRDPEGAWFMERFLALFETVFTGVEDRYEAFSRELNPDAAPLEIINWLACLVDLSFDPSWPLERRRALVNRAMELYRKRGTPEGIRQYIEIYTGTRPEILEAFLQRPVQPAFLGRPGSILGCAMHLSRCGPERLPEEQLLYDHAHRFSVLVYLDDECDAEPLLAVVERIVEVNKPAHTAHTLCPIYPSARVAVQSTLGLDLVVGGRQAPATPVGGCPTLPGTKTPAGLLGVDSILGQKRPSYVRPLERRI